MFSRRGLITVLLLSMGACRKPEFTHQLAVLRFENLTPDASTDWIGRAVSEEIAGQLEGTRHNAILSFGTIHGFENRMGPRPVNAPGISAERSAAIAAGANRILTGTYTYQNGTLSLWATEMGVAGESATGEEQDTKSALAELHFSGTLDDLLHVTDEAARAIDEEARPPITGSARALRSYALGLEAPPGEAKPLFQEAIGLDPDFGPPYVALAGMALEAKDTAAFGNIFDQARARGGGMRAVDRAILNLEDARLHAQTTSSIPAAQVDALGALAKLEPADPVRWEELADAEFETNRYAEAADHFRRLATLLPASAEPLNRLGYALMYGGDEPGAMEAFAQYRKASGDGANAFDSTGDAEMFFGHFAEAEKSYLEAHRRNPELDAGTALLKAAWTRLMRHDEAGTRKLVAAYQAQRRWPPNPLSELHAAQVLRLLGEKPVVPFPLQMAWWNYLDGKGAAPENAGAMGEAVRALENREWAQAVPLWRKLAEEAPPGEWWTRRVYARVLDATGQGMERDRYARFTPPPQPNRMVSLDELWVGSIKR